MTMEHSSKINLLLGIFNMLINSFDNVFENENILFGEMGRQVIINCHYGRRIVRSSHQIKFKL